MGDWLQVHHCVVCADHATAVCLYQRLERAAERMERSSGQQSGLRWGFWNTRGLIVSTTEKWGSDPTFLDPLIEGLDLERFMANEDEDSTAEADSDGESVGGAARFELALRHRLGATRDFLWCDQAPVMRALLDHFELLDTGHAKLALLPKKTNRAFALPESVRAALAPLTYSSIVYGFLTNSGECLGLGAFGAGDDTRSESLLWTPLAGVRARGRTWALHAELDGSEPIPLHLASAADLWRIERHGALLGWQLREQRLALVRASLADDSVAEKQAGCAMARRSGLIEVEPSIAVLLEHESELVREAAEYALYTLAPAKYPPPAGNLTEVEDVEDDENDDEPLPSATAAISDEALRVNLASLRAASEDESAPDARNLAWLALAERGDASDASRALAILDDAHVGGAARWAVASLGDVASSIVVSRVVGACADLGEIGDTFLTTAWRDESLGRVFVARLAELAYAATRTSYWMVRYGVPYRDFPADRTSAEDGDRWKGEMPQSAARLLHWAGRAMDTARQPYSASLLLRAYVAFDEILAASRANRVWWPPPIGIVHEGLRAMLDGRADVASSSPAPMPGGLELASLHATYEELMGLYRLASTAPDHGPELERKTREALAQFPPPLSIVCYSVYGRAAFRLVAWLANNLAWRMFERGAAREALPYAELAITCADWNGDAIRDTLARILGALGRTQEADAIDRVVKMRAGHFGG